MCNCLKLTVVSIILKSKNIMKKNKRNKENKSSLTVKQFFSFLFKQASPFKLSLLTIIFAILYAVIYNLACPLLYKVLFDDVIPNKNVNLLIIIACALIGGLLLLVVINTIKAWLNSKLGASITNMLRQKMLEHTNSNLLAHNFKKSNYLQQGRTQTI